VAHVAVKPIVAQNLNLKTSQVGSTIQLRATTPLMTAGTQSGVTDYNSLKNPLAYPILVDEILFNIQESNVDAADGADMRVQLRVGRDEIVRAYTPLWLLGKNRNQSVRSSSYGSSVPSTTMGSYYFNQQNAPLYSCKFGTSLVLMPGEILEPIFYHAGIVYNDSFTVRMIVKARVLPQETQRTSWPWISYWAGALQVPGSNYTEQSTEANLCNPHPQPFYVDRMVGVIGSHATLASLLTPYSVNSAIDAALNYCLIRMSDAAGRPIIRDNTPFGHVFQMRDFCWELGGVTMPPNGFWYAYLTENYATLQTNSLQAMMSVIGWRPAT
jgi:hypothetical protein